MGLITIDVSARDNQPPSSSGWLSISLAYGATYVFTLADFTTETNPPYSDPEGDALEAIKVTSLPQQGLLKLNGIAILVDAEITSAQLSNSEFTYESDASDNDGYSDGYMEFTVSDVGSSTFTTFPQVVTFEVGSSINESPNQVGDGEADVIVGQEITITTTMLTTSLNPPYEDPEGNPPLNLIVDSVPIYGDLYLNGILVVDGQEISFTDIGNNLLTYKSNEFPDSSLEGFTFGISDTGSGEYTR